jgi:hypothetical protein
MSEGRTEPIEFPTRVRWYGKDEPLPERVPVRAGPLRAIVEGGDLRYVMIGEDPVVLRLYAAIRDRNWNTIEPRFTSYELEQSNDGFSVRFTAENVSGEVDFAWQGAITGTSDGVIVATMDGVARRDFQRNRIGWCVLHPMEVAGTAATTETPDGTVEGVFPERIAPHQPFFDMQSISHETPSGGQVTIRLEGDLWEMEDQRNWTDASYKTYSTPLRIPYPVQLREGDRVRQTVTIIGSGAASPAKAEAGPIRVAVDPSRAKVLPGIGLGVANHGAPLADADIALLKEVQPDHLFVSLDLTSDGWRDALTQAASEARALNATLAIEAIAGAEGEGLKELAEAAAHAGVSVSRVLVFAEGSLDTTGPVLDGARKVFATAGVDAPVGGGTRGYFTELNRAAGTLPLNRMDVVGYTINAQVHAFDNASLTETLAAQPETVRSARAFIGDRTLAVGPITLKPPFNPNATGPEPKPAPGELPAAVDARQPSLFTAGWLVGSLNALGNAEVDALTYFETTGWRGVIERRDHPLRVSKFHSWPGMVFPIYHVLADVAEFRGGDIMPVELGDGLRVQALALRSGNRVRVLLANMTDVAIDVSLTIPGANNAMVRRLDDASFALAASNPAAFRGSAQSARIEEGSADVMLPPYAVATMDAGVGPV